MDTTYAEPVTFTDVVVNETYQRMLREVGAPVFVSPESCLKRDRANYEPLSATTSGSVSVFYLLPIEQTYAYHYDREMLQLERAVLLEDEEEFIHLVNQMNWQIRCADDYLKAVKLALRVGAHLTARRLSQEGATRFPNHVEIGKYARVLAPVKTIRSDVPSDPGVAKNNLWLKRHRNEYRGSWVALRDGELLASGKSLQDVKNQVGPLKNSRILVTRVY
jgi:hypothetical protein